MQNSCFVSSSIPMNVTIVNGTNRIGNRSIEISQSITQIYREMKCKPKLVTLNNFTSLFRENYIDVKVATPAQKRDIHSLMTAQIIIFVIPTYHSGVPSALKNFLDTLKCGECYDQKVIGIISSNDSNRDLGARQAAQTINGILAYLKLRSLVVPIIPIINFDNIDQERIKNFIHYCSQFMCGKNQSTYAT